MPDTKDSIDRSDFMGLPLRVEAKGGAFADEIVAVTRMSDGRYLVRLSPGFVRGVAAGDVIDYDEASKSANVIERGGNIAVQVFHRGIAEEIIATLKRNTVEVGGRVDGELSSLVVLTFPLDIGFPAIESVLARLPEAGIEWDYGNVFDAQGEPLSWWK
ncbi:DUF4265 domain-containing protein [Streptomyces sp. TBY4]|uniref:DUF4265 domain-containing protein n=1 Tax=Streptomyces sp. TBY4 TaxID=2962030 RepID=UPI0020B847D0|nr:DUF4265 domain-containing protein [Streptomyces sp. TBY4]MCP3755994.1 DUF4265 domain-containing protein [Streptomyces sp. TBY4]